MNSFDEAVQKSKELPTWSQVAEVVEEAPQLPSTIQKILSLIENGFAVDLRVLSAIIEKDAGLAAKILKVANSSLFNQTKSVTNILAATSIIGLKTLKGILISTTLKDLQSPDTDFLKYAWKKSYLTCNILRSLPPFQTELDIEDLATLGLIHNIGEIVLGGNSKFKNLTVKAYDQAIQQSSGVTFILEDFIKFKSSLVSALLLKKWNFPDSISLHVLHRDSPLEFLNWGKNKLMAHAAFQMASLSAEVLLLKASESSLEYRVLRAVSKNLPDTLSLETVLQKSQNLLSDSYLEEIG